MVLKTVVRRWGIKNVGIPAATLQRRVDEYPHVLIDSRQLLLG